MKISVETQKQVLNYILNSATVNEAGVAIKEDFVKNYGGSIFNPNWVYDHTRVFIGRSKSNQFKIDVVIQSEIGITLELSFRISETQIVDKYKTIYRLEMTSETDNYSSYYVKTGDDCYPISDGEAGYYKQMCAKQKSGKSNLASIIEELYEKLNSGESIIITKQ